MLNESYCFLAISPARQLLKGLNRTGLHKEHPLQITQTREEEGTLSFLTSFLFDPVLFRGDDDLVELGGRVRRPKSKVTFQSYHF